MKGEEPRQGKATPPLPAVPAATGDRRAAGPSGPSSDALFLVGLGTLLGSYIALVVGLLFALGTFTTFSHILAAIKAEEIRFALRLSLISCTLSTLLSLWVAIPGATCLSRLQVSRAQPGRCRDRHSHHPAATGHGPGAVDPLSDRRWGGPWSGLCPSRLPRPASCWRSSPWPARSPCERCASHSIRSALARNKSR